MANDQGLELVLRANIKQLKKDLKDAEKDLESFKKKAGEGGDGFGKIEESLKSIKSSGIFKEIDKATGGIASGALDIISGFKGATVGVQGFKLALASTGIGAIVVAVGAIAVYWDDISNFVNGVNRELSRQLAIQEKQAEVAQYQVDLINSQLDTLKLQGATDKEINAIKRDRLNLLLQEKLQILDTAKTQLKVAVEAEKSSRELLSKMVSAAAEASYLMAQSLDSVFGTNFKDDVVAASQAVTDFLVGGDSEEAKKKVQDLNLEIAKIQNTIDKTKLSDIKIDTKSAEEAKKEAEDLAKSMKGLRAKSAAEAKKEAEDFAKFMKRLDADLEILDEEKLKEDINGVNEILQNLNLKIENFSKLELGDFGLGDGAEQVDRFAEKLEKIRKMLNDPDFNFSGVLTDGEVDKFIDNLRRGAKEAEFIQLATSEAIGEISGTLAAKLKTDNELFDSFTGAIISTGQKLLEDLIAQSLASNAAKAASVATQVPLDTASATSSAIAGASTTAAASGPAAAFLLPGLIGLAIGFIGAAFSGIKFAGGGIVPGGSYHGDRVPAMLNSAEMVLNTGQQKNLFDIANGSLRGSSQSGGSDNINISGAVRGDNILLSSDRSRAKRNRFYK